MSELPRITVIMGIYNCADTLIEALESLESQTYKRFKVVLCDDGSKDNTLEVALKWAETHPNYVVIQNERNIKLAATLNHCLKYADTEYVARMDGDDISLPTRFEKEIAFLDLHPEFAFVSTPMAHFDEHGIWRKGKAIEYPQNCDFRDCAPFCHAPCMVRKSAYDLVNGYTTGEKVERAEDFYLWYKMYRSGLKGYNIQEILYMMRDDKNAIARRRVKDRLRGVKMHWEIPKGLNVKYPYLIILKSLSKILVPPFLIPTLRKLKK